MLKGDVSSPFSGAESDEEDITEPAKEAPKKLDETLIKQSSSGQKGLLKCYSKQIPLVKHMMQMQDSSLCCLFLQKATQWHMKVCLQ